MVSDEFQKRDRNCDDNLLQPSTHAVGFSKTVITGKNPFSLPSSEVSEINLQSYTPPGAAH